LLYQYRAIKTILNIKEYF